MGPSRFLDVVQSFVDEPVGAELLGLGPQVAIAGLRDGSFAMVVDGHGADIDAVQPVLAQFVEDTKGTDLKLVVVDGDERWRAVLSRLQPSVMMGRVVQVFLLGVDRDVWVGARTRTDSPVGLVLATVGGRELPREIDGEVLSSHVRRSTPAERAHAREVHTFVQNTREGTPFATYALMAGIAVVFGLEWMWGGTESIPTLVRMGANDSTTFEGQPWRLLSAAWLHAGPLHMLVNTYVLFSLGGFLERLLGAPRMLVLYVAAALGGGVASAMFSSAALSVGASGAIWGLLGASAALAWRPAGIIPDAVLPAVRRNAMVNLVINLAVSFLPAIDIMAHVGGGLVGGALVLGGVITRGATQRPRLGARAWMGAAIVSVGLLVVAPVLAIATDRPWRLLSSEVVTRDLGRGATIEVPETLGPPDAAEQGGRVEVMIGDPLRDRGAITVVIERFEGPPQDVATLDGAIAEILALELPLPEGATRDAEPAALHGAERRGRIDRYSFENGLESFVVFAMYPTASVRIEAVWWSTAPELGAQLLDAAESLAIP